MNVYIIKKSAIFYFSFIILCLLLNDGVLQANGSLVSTHSTALAKLPLLLRQLEEPLLDYPKGFGVVGREGGKRELTIIPELQNDLRAFIKRRGNPIAAIVLVDVATGNVLAMTQGLSPQKWGGNTHTALHEGFPAASLFKTIVAISAFEVAGLQAQDPIGLIGGCTNIHPTGYWMRWDVPGNRNRITLKRAYGNSCNGFFAKIAINYIGLGPIVAISRKLGWGGEQIPADFNVPVSPITFPSPLTSSTHTIGRFAAGFGYVGISAAHAAWQALVIAKDGIKESLKIFKDNIKIKSSKKPERLLSVGTAEELREIMKATILGGTASFAFKYGKYRKLRYITGGKTGTLTGYSPKGLTTWFVGMTPIEKPEVVVASIVVLEDLWIFKAPTLAAEAFVLYNNHKSRAKALSTAKFKNKSKNSSL